CLLRRTQTAQLPTFFGLPAATYTEHSCVALGDATCDYEFRFYSKGHWLAPVLGFALGAAFLALVAHFEAMAMSSFVTLPLIGMLAGWFLEVRRTYAANLEYGEQI